MPRGFSLRSITLGPWGPPGRARPYYRYLPSSSGYDSVLVLSFGGPERREDVLPFLENVTRGRDIPRARLLAVAEHYYRGGGRSPINEQNRELVRGLQAELEARGPRLPVFFGNRNWRPFLTDTLREMRDQGHRRALVYVTSAFGSYSGCRQYLDDMARARAELAGEAGGWAPELRKLRLFYNHPGYVAAVTDRVRAAAAERPGARLLFTAHSIPIAMAATSPYEAQLRAACALVAARLERTEWDLAFQSRSGPPTQPWLEPELEASLRKLASEPGARAAGVVLVPIGFMSDHMEVVHDLDVEARELCAELHLPMRRAATAGTHPEVIAMIRDLIREQTEGRDGAPPAALGSLGAWPDICPDDCCPRPAPRG